MRRRTFIGGMGAVLAGATAGLPALSAAASPGQGREFDPAGFDAARRFVGTPSGEIAYVEQGAGDAALFLHGFPLNGFQWRGAMARLSAHRRCIAPDVLGLGHTRVAAGQSHAPRAQAEMLVQLLDRLDVAVVDLVANDSGNAVAQLLLAHHPARVRSLLLTNGDSEIECPPPALRPVIDLARRGEFVAQWLAPWLADKALARSTEGLGGLTYTFPEKLADATIDTYLAPLVADPDRTHAFTLALEDNSLAGIGASQRQCEVPVRIVWGTGDATFSTEGARHLDRSYGRSRGIRWVEGANLFFPEEFPDLIAAEARALWGVG